MLCRSDLSIFCPDFSTDRAQRHQLAAAPHTPGPHWAHVRAHSRYEAVPDTFQTTLAEGRIEIGDLRVENRVRRLGGSRRSRVVT